MTRKLEFVKNKAEQNEVLAPPLTKRSLCEIMKLPYLNYAPVYNLIPFYKHLVF